LTTMALVEPAWMSISSPISIGARAVEIGCAIVCTVSSLSKSNVSPWKMFRFVALVTMADAAELEIEFTWTDAVRQFYPVPPAVYKHVWITENRCLLRNLIRRDQSVLERVTIRLTVWHRHSWSPVTGKLTGTSTRVKNLSVQWGDWYFSTSTEDTFCLFYLLSLLSWLCRLFDFWILCLFCLLYKITIFIFILYPCTLTAHPARPLFSDIKESDKSLVSYSKTRGSMIFNVWPSEIANLDRFRKSCSAHSTHRQSRVTQNRPSIWPKTLFSQRNPVKPGNPVKEGNNWW